MIIVTCTDDRAVVLRGDRARRPGGPVPSRLALVNLAQSAGMPTLAIAFIAVAAGFGGSALPETAASGEGAARGSSPASVRACVRRDASEADVTPITMQFFC
jgi:hypothetical protein